MDPRRSRQRGQRSWGGFFHYYVCERFDQTHQRRRRGRGLDRWLATQLGNYEGIMPGPLTRSFSLTKSTSQPPASGCLRRRGKGGWMDVVGWIGILIEGIVRDGMEVVQAAKIEFFFFFSLSWNLDSIFIHEWIPKLFISSVILAWNNIPSNGQIFFIFSKWSSTVVEMEILFSKVRAKMSLIFLVLNDYFCKQRRGARKKQRFRL